MNKAMKAAVMGIMILGPVQARAEGWAGAVWDGVVVFGDYMTRLQRHAVGAVFVLAGNAGHVTGLMSDDTAVEAINYGAATLHESEMIPDSDDTGANLSWDMTPPKLVPAYNKKVEREAAFARNFGVRAETIKEKRAVMVNQTGWNGQQRRWAMEARLADEQGRTLDANLLRAQAASLGVSKSFGEILSTGGLGYARLPPRLGAASSLRASTVAWVRYRNSLDRAIKVGFAVAIPMAVQRQIDGIQESKARISVMRESAVASCDPSVQSCAAPAPTKSLGVCDVATGQCH